MNLRPASQFTIEELAEAYNKTRVDYLVPMPMTPRRLQEYIHDYDVQLDCSAVAVDDGRLIGLAMLGIRGNAGWITRLGVLPESRKHHTGLRLVEHCLSQAAERLAESVFLEVIVGNTAAHNLFARLGFHETRKLLVLRRPPGLPPESPTNPALRTPVAQALDAKWLGHDQAVQLAAARHHLPAWTNRTETFVNVPGIRAIQIESQRGTGWVSYEETEFQLRRVMIGASGDQAIAPTHNLLHCLHTQFPQLDTIAENIPADSPDLSAFYAHGYVASFVRIEMMRSVAG